MPLQDLEKLAPKKGVVLQSVKEVVQALVDDDLGEAKLPMTQTAVRASCCPTDCLQAVWTNSDACQLFSNVLLCSAPRQDWSIKLLLVFSQRSGCEGAHGSVHLRDASHML